jgi:Bacterial Ig-like domain (group 3)/FG-GAP-like repeat
MLKFSRFTALVTFIALTTSSGNRVLAQMTRPRPHQKVSHQGASASPLFTGTDGSETGVAKFQGNYTVITAPPGQVLALLRQTNCSLLFLTGTYSNGSSFSYTSTGMTTNYERTLHTEAGLTTTADSAPAGCVDPNRGIGARPATYVGKTTSGVNVYAGVFYNFMTQNESLYVLTGATSFNVSILSFSRAGLLSTADVNGDGNSDLIIVNGVSSTSAGAAQVYVMLGNADGTFGTATPYTVPGANSLTAVVDDFNGDGKLDIVATSDTGQVSLLTGKGDGTFNTAQSFTPPTPAYPGSSLTPSASIFNLISADLRGTGHKDLIGSNGLVLLNDGTGNFTAAANAAFPPTTSLTNGGPYLATGDINRDGKLDLVVSGNGLNTYIGKGDGTFTPGIGYVTVNTDGFVTVTDLDGDGNPDIYVGDANNGLFRGDSDDTNIAYALMGNGDGTFSGAPMITGQYTGNNLGDVNGDGQPDLITNNIGQYNQTLPTFTVQLGTSKGTFNPVSTITLPSTVTITSSQITSPVTLSSANASITSYAVGDLNGDGKADLAFLVNYNGLPVYFTALSNGNGTFATPIGYGFPQIAPAGGYDNQPTVGNLQIGDFNHDGKADLIFNFTDIAEPVQTYLQGLAVLPGNGDGTYGSPVFSYTYNSTTAPATYNNPPTVVLISDLNGDGNPDLIAANSTFAIVNGFGVTTTALQTYTGKGDGTFNPPNTILTTNRLGPIVLADFNHDGKLDVAALAEQVSTQNNTAQGQLYIALGKGDGTFAAPTTQLLDGGDVVPESGLAAADFDGDGNIDLADLTAESFSGILYGKGDGTFTSVPIQDGAIAPKDLVNLSVGTASGTIALDLNHDGHPDILTGNAILLSLYGSAVTSPPPTLFTTTTALTSSASSPATGGSITFTAIITGASGSTGTPTGTVNFLDGTTSLGTGTLTSGIATYTTTALAAGSHSVTAVYSGDAAFSPSTSSSLTITVTAPPPPAAAFAITLANANGTVARGSNITDTITITPTGGFNQAVALTCTGAPTNSTCALSPASVTPNGTAAITSTLTLTADILTASLTRTRHDFEVAAILPLGLLSSVAIFTLGRRRKISWVVQLLALATISTLLAAVGCGGHHTTTTTPPPATTNTPTPGTYSLTVTATSGATTHSVTYTVTIQ